jgi:hypothetical protein
MEVSLVLSDVDNPTQHFLIQSEPPRTVEARIDIERAKASILWQLAL